MNVAFNRSLRHCWTRTRTMTKTSHCQNPTRMMRNCCLNHPSLNRFHCPSHCRCWRKITRFSKNPNPQSPVKRETHLLESDFSPSFFFFFFFETFSLAELLPPSDLRFKGLSPLASVAVAPSRSFISLIFLFCEKKANRITIVSRSPHSRRIRRRKKNHHKTTKQKLTKIFVRDVRCKCLRLFLHSYDQWPNSKHFWHLTPFGKAAAILASLKQHIKSHQQITKCHQSIRQSTVISPSACKLCAMCATNRIACGFGKSTSQPFSIRFVQATRLTFVFSLILPLPNHRASFSPKIQKQILESVFFQKSLGRGRSVIVVSDCLLAFVFALCQINNMPKPKKKQNSTIVWKMSIKIDDLTVASLDSILRCRFDLPAGIFFSEFFEFGKILWLSWNWSKAKQFETNIYFKIRKKWLSFFHVKVGFTLTHSEVRFCSKFEIKRERNLKSLRDKVDEMRAAI